ncbi:MAG: phosphatase PAP2 family protein [Bdellovibrionota bacterium]
MSNDATSSKRTTLCFIPTNADLAFVVFGAIFYYLISHTGFPFSRTLLLQIIDDVVQLTFIVMLLAVPIVCARMVHQGWKFGFATLKRKDVVLRLVQPYFTLEFVFLTFRRAGIALGAIFLFVHLKHLILWWHPENFDRQLWDLDRKIHFGVQPNIWAMNTLSPYPTLTVLVDWLYIQYFQYKLIVAMIFLMEPRGRKLSNQFFLAFELMWFIGGLLYLAVPADGPCFAVLSQYSVPHEEQAHMFRFPVVDDIPQSFAEQYSHARIWYAKVYQEQLWTDRRDFLTGKDLPGIFYGIAAMPSLHVAAVSFMAFFLFRASVLGGIIGAAYALVIFFGSMFLQWHYAVDGYAGFALACFITWVSTKTPELWPLVFRQKKADCDQKILQK